MQSQQKKVKWSRGETADALEERTDTGITQVSVSKMENIIADIYGNISRRPALKVIDSVTGASEIPVLYGSGILGSHTFNVPPESFVFTIDAKTYIIFIVDKALNIFGGFLIQNNKFVRRITINYSAIGTLSPQSTYGRGKVSVSQYNNYMIVANLFLPDVIFSLQGATIDDYSILIQRFQFSAPWYAPNGTQTTQVTPTQVAGLNFDAGSVGNYTFTEANGETTVYSWISTGINQSAVSGTWAGPTTTYYVNGAVRWIAGNTYQVYPTEISTTQGNTVLGSFTMTNGQTYNNNQTVCTYTAQDFLGNYISETVKVDIHNNTTQFSTSGITLNVSEYMSVAIPSIAEYIPIGSIVQFPNNGSYMRVEGFDSDGTHLRMYGALLVPLADDSAHDSIVKVETGYLSLNDYQPLRVTFSQQRLYASAFHQYDANPVLIPGYVVGSQIARYTDFKNDYNTKNEAITIDISTAYQEQIVSLIDYNGLKIFTDAAEYTIVDGAPVKQSENGSLAVCQPIIFGSLCLYADKSGSQIRAMQYELQSNQFDSSSINQMTQEDLIFNTDSMAGFRDKEHFTGHFLYAIQTGYQGTLHETPMANHSIAVCNFVPGNQSMIWSRWNTPWYLSPIENYKRHSVQNIIEVNNKVWFIVACVRNVKDTFINPGYTLAELDYDALMDFETEQKPTDTQYYLIKPIRDYDLYAWDDGNGHIYYTKNINVLEGELVYSILNNNTLYIVGTAGNSPAGPNITIGGVDYYEWRVSGGSSSVYTKDMIPNPTGERTDPSRQIFDANGDLITNQCIHGFSNPPYEAPRIMIGPISGGGAIWGYNRIFDTLSFNLITATYNGLKNQYPIFATLPGNVSVFDGDEYKWDDKVDPDYLHTGTLTKPLTDLTNPHIGFMINATLESHPIDIQGKTYTEKKRIGKCVAVIRNTDAGAFTVCDKTGYTAKDKKTVNFYGCTGMKDLIRYTIKNIQGAKFTIESLTMIVEYGTLDS